MNALPQFSAPNTGALRFADIDNESVQVAHDAALSAASFTVEAWVATTNTDGDFNRVVTKAVGGGQTYSLVVINGEAQVRSSVGVITSTGVTVADGDPHHFAGVYDSVAETLALYVDGALISSISTAGQTLTQGTEDVFIGDYPGGFVEAFDGDISDVRIWSDVRTTEEIAATFDQSLDGGAPNLELHLRFDGDATDSSGNGRDGVINGSPVFVEGLAPVDPLPFDPMTLAATEDVSEAITGLQVSDADPGAVLTVTVEVTSGALTLATTTGLTFTAGGNGQATFTAQGSVADLNAALATLSYLGDPDFNGVDTVILTVDDGEPEVVEPVAGAQVIPNSGTFFLYDFDTGIGSTEAQTAADPVNPPTNGVYIVINPNNDHWSTGASLVVDGVITVLPPENFNLVGYAGASSITAGTLARFEDAITGLTLIYTNDDTPTPTGARDITFTFNGLDFNDAPPGDMNLDDADFRMSSEAVVEIPVTVASVVDAAPVITQVQAAGEVFEPEASAKTAFEIDDFDLLDGANGFNIFGEDAEHRLGNAVAGLGDVNGDGFDDFIVGVYGEDNGALVNLGAAHVVFGAANGLPADLDLSTLDGANGFTVNGVEGSDSVGASVDGIGDINSDGFDDIIIGARGASEVFSNGEAYIVYGKASGFSAELTAADLDGTVGTAVGGVSFSFFGGSVSGAGDVNGDGIDDFIIGAQTRATAAGSQAGATYIVYGQVGGLGASFDVTTLDGSNGFAIEGVNAGDRVGFAVDGGGDINGDGFDDLLVGAYRASSNGLNLNGAAYVIFGGPDGFDGDFDLNTIDGTNGFIMEGNADTQRLGQNIAVIGDINDDGLDDFAIGVTEISPNGVTVAGQVFVVFGQTGGAFPASLDLFSLDGTNGFTINGAAAGDRIGASLDAAGDLNADGIDDFIIGGGGQAIIVFGDDAGFAATLEVSALDGQNGAILEDGVSGSALGRAVAGVGDFNGDGIDDIIAGDRVATINGDSAAGRTATVFGASENAAASGEIQFQNDGSRASHTVATAVTGGLGLGVFSAEIVDAHDPGGLGVVEWNFLISAAELDPLAAGEIITQTYDVVIANADASVVQSITVTINGANDTPVAADDDFATGEKSTISGNLIADNGFGPDTDVDFGALLSVIEIDGNPVFDGEAVLLASGATLTIRSDGTFDYDPNGAFDTLAEGATAPDGFTYTIADEFGATATATANVTITGVNDPPVALDDAFSTDEDTPIIGGDLFDVSVGQDSDPDSAIIVSAINGAAVFDGQTVSLGSGALLTIRSDGTFDYDPNGAFEGLAEGAFGADSFAYTITETEGGTDTATASFTIAGANDDPIAFDESFDLEAGAPLSSNLFFDPNSDGFVSFDPDGDALSISQINGAVVADGNVIELASGAFLTIRTDGSFDYDQQGQFDGLPSGATATDSFTYQIADGLGGVSTATATLNITGVSSPAVAVNDEIPAGEDAPVSGDLLADNGVGPDSGDGLLVTEINGAPVFDGQSVPLASGAILLIRTDGTFDYDPNGAFERLPEGVPTSDSFTYTIADNLGGISTATANVTVFGANDAPIASDESVDLDVDAPLSSNLLFDLNSDGFQTSDPDGDALSISQINGAPIFDGQVITLASGASLTIRTDGSFDYDQQGQFAGLASGQTATDSFTYQIDDGFGGVSTATATLTISSPGLPLVAVNDEIPAEEDTPVSGDLLADNGLGVDTGDGLVVTRINGAPVFDGQIVTLFSGALLTIRADGTFDYDTAGAFETLGAGAEGFDDFTYTLADANGGTAEATAIVTINGANDAPVAANDTFVAPGGESFSGDLTADNGFGPDSDIDAGAILTVTEINGAPVSDGESIILPSGAILTIRADGTFDYDPAGATGSDSFAYSISDGFGGTSNAIAEVLIESGNTAPDARDDAFSLQANGVVTGNFLVDNGQGADTDADGDLLSIVQIADLFLPQNGAPVTATLGSGAEVSFSSDGAFVYDASAAFAGLGGGEVATDQFTYLLSDQQGGLTAATATFAVTGVEPEPEPANTAPVARDDAFSTDEDTAIGGLFLLEDNGAGADADEDGDALTLLSIEGVDVGAGDTVQLTSGAVVTVGDEGDIAYDPNAAFDALQAGEIATDSFVYQITDGQGGTSEAAVRVEIAGLSDILFGSEESDILEGTAGADDIRALGGGDFVSGFAGDDVISGGGGNDRARGGLGEDSLDGGEGDDALFGEGGDDVLAGGDGNDRLRGQRGDDRLLGEDGDDVLAGARGDDTLLGGDGADTLAGGGGNDLLRGQTGDDKLGGSRGDDMLIGGAGGDRIRGGGGDDTLIGGNDDDTLIGGAGADLFQFAASDGSDIIRRFQQGSDLIEITSEGIGFDDLSIVQQGANVSIGFGATDVLLVAQNSADFDAEDFIFFG